jgi:SAM-dependent methyltransferase
MTFETSHTVVEAELLESSLRSGAVVLEAGCGRTTRLGSYRSRIARLVGADLDNSAGQENEALDEFHHIDVSAPLPFEDAYFDLIYGNFVVEHLAAPEAAFRHWRRVLRPDGALLLVTSNVSNPLLASARLLPQAVRVWAKRAGPGAVERDVFPTPYRTNTPGRLSASLTAARFTPADLRFVATLHRYAGNRQTLRRALVALERRLPAHRRSTIVALARPV